MMDPAVIWNGLLTFAFAMLGWVLKGYVDEVKRLNILLNRTREGIAKEYITKAEVHADINRVITRLETLDAKLDRLLESKLSKGS